MFAGRKLRESRTALHISQELLAEKLNVHVNTIRRWEQNKQAPDANSLAKISEILGVNLSDLLTDEDRKQNSPMMSEEHARVEETSRYKNDAGNFVFQKGDLHIEVPNTEDNAKWFKEIITRAISGLMPQGNTQAV